MCFDREANSYSYFAVMHDFIDQIQSFSEVHLTLLSCLQFILVVILNTIYLSYSRNSVSLDGLLEMYIIVQPVQMGFK